MTGLNNILPHIQTILVIVLSLVTFYEKVVKPQTSLSPKMQYHLSDAITTLLKPLCKEIRVQFGASRVLFWQFKNGTELMKNWPEKDMNAIAEDYDDHLPEFASKFQHVPNRIFNRNLHLLWNSPDDTLFIADESLFQDELSELNIQYGWRSMAACFCKNRKGQEIGILVVGWTTPQNKKEVNWSQLKRYATSYYSMVYSVIAKYTWYGRMRFGKKLLRN